MNTINFTPFPKLATKHLTLRQLNMEDEKEIFVHRSDERILKYIDIPKAETIEDARNFIEKINKGIDENEWVYWEITFKNDSQLIGTICL
jgi:ribosomal-protein-alanine N-acetyltransferase